MAKLTLEHLSKWIKKYRPNTVACMNVDENGKPVSITLTKQTYKLHDSDLLPQEEISIKESDE